MKSIKMPSASQISPDHSSAHRSATNQERLPVTRDIDIREVLLRDLRKEFSDSSQDLILEEFGCKTVRIDVAVINGALHGYEIKSDSDSLTRLPFQVEEYSKLFDYVTLVCGRKLLLGAQEVIPAWWGLQIATLKSAEVTVTPIRDGSRNPSQSNAALARMFWKGEALRCLRRHGHKGVTSKHPAEEIWTEAARLLSTRTLADEARLAIKSRGGSGFAKRSTQGDDSCTTESNLLENHSSKNLAWLLSQLSPHRPY
jgi:hypothetical protein